MTASTYVAGTHVASAEQASLGGDRRLDGAVPTTHAVSTPVVDGLASSVCGELVTADAALDWQAVSGVPRCEECQRIAG